LMDFPIARRNQHQLQISNGRKRSECETSGHLHDAWVARRRDQSKSAGVDFPTRIVELRVIEDIESLEAQLKFRVLNDLGAFLQCHVEVIQSGSVEEPSTGISELSQLFIAEERGVEIRVSVTRVGIG